MADLGDMTLEKFKLWSSNALRVFLSMRKKPINGDFDELSARAFCAWDDNIAVDKDAEQGQIRLLAEYKAKLLVDGKHIDDPLTQTNGWTGEKTSMTKWPALYIMDISEYLNGKNHHDLMKRLLNEYKEGKAFRYFSGEWVKEIFYRDIESSDHCVVKSKVTPSMAVNNKNYDTWIVLKKDVGNLPGGQIVQAYCSCTAGMLGSCNHIAGVLFRIEHAVKTGLTRPTCTSKTCEWTVPKKKTTIKPGKVTDFIWKKSHYSKLPALVEKENRKKIVKKSFTPLNKTQQKKIKDVETLRQELHGILKNDIPDSCFALNMDKRRIVNVSVSSKPLLPSTPKEIAKCVPTDLSNQEKIDFFINKMAVSDEDISALQSETLNQSKSDQWKEHRKGRVTASNFHRVCHRSKSLRKKSEEDPTSVVNEVMGAKPFIQTQAMKHGISSEPIAKRSYMSLMKTTHKQLVTEESGMIIYKDKPYISASPDLLVRCKCCGEGLCEIKCPESIKGQIPTTDNVKYIYLKDNIVTLNKNHPYYYQVQGQMGITKRSYCDLFVFTFHGHICTRILFDETFFSEMIEDLSWFWINFVVDSLLKSERVLMEKVTNN